MVDHVRQSTLFFLKNLSFQLIHELPWQVDVIKNVFKFVLKLLIASQMQILQFEDVVWGSLDVVWGGFGLTWQVNVIKMLLNFFFSY